MLYIAFGDGGFQRDPNGNGQNPRIHHGSMLRIDVDQQPDGRPYGIPPDNPFLAAHEADPTILPETWAIGLREPWRFSFDAATGDLWLGDVGQDAFEEVCLVRPGENHGWNVYEGFEPFSDEYRREGETFAFPLFVYPHSFGVSVTGGFVYRGERSPTFEGVYIFGDYDTRRVWGLTQHGGRLTSVRELGECPEHIASFGYDETGELYVVGYEGTIFHLDLSRSRFE
jgi:glucose/arabinose dehydrogenase